MSLIKYKNLQQFILLLSNIIVMGVLRGVIMLVHIKFDV